MGSGCYSDRVYKHLKEERGFDHRSESELFCNTLGAAEETLASSFNVKARVNNTNVRKEMLNVGVRESRDTTEHPYTTPIIIAFDVTGSMGDRPQEMVKTQFPKLMDKLIQIGVKDPQLLFMAIGDTVFDEYPLQAGQFESDTEKILDSIQAIHIERGGGSNAGEDYSLAWIMAGYHTETDSWYKRHRKGFLFTMGDEPCLKSISGPRLEKFLGYQKGAKEITAKEALEKAKEQYEVFHIYINAQWSYKEIEKGWRDLVGDHLLSCEAGEIANTIADTVRKFYVPEGEDSTEETAETEVETVENPSEKSQQEEDDLL
jgi:hypothetical protein